MAPNDNAINHCFGAKTAEEIVVRLSEVAENDVDPSAIWAGKTLKSLTSVSPTSVKVDNPNNPNNPNNPY